MDRRGECGYCGPKNYVPPGWDYIKTKYECLRSGFAVGKFNERKAWQVRLRLPVDPPYVSRCGDNRLINQSIQRSRLRVVRRNTRNRNRRNRSRSIPRNRRSRSRTIPRNRRSRSRTIPRNSSYTRS